MPFSERRHQVDSSDVLVIPPSRVLERGQYIRHPGLLDEILECSASLRPLLTAVDRPKPLREHFLGFTACRQVGYCSENLGAAYPFQRAVHTDRVLPPACNPHLGSPASLEKRALLKSPVAGHRSFLSGPLGNIRRRVRGDVDAAIKAPRSPRPVPTTVS